MDLDRKKRLLYLVFMLSGAGGLIYESIWSHYLKLFLGHAAYAQSLVLAIFMGGMGIGALIAGRYGVRLRSPLQAYAMAEFAIGVSALVFHGVFDAFMDFSYERVLPSTSNLALAELYRWGSSAMLILPQSILLGLTFPLMSAALLRQLPMQSGPVLSGLYFTNSLGAAIGVMVGGFVLIAAVGLPGTLMTAGILNLFVALLAWGLAKSLPFAPPLAQKPTPFDSTSKLRIGIAVPLGVAFLTGVASFIYEIIWIRMLTMVMGGSTHSFEIMLATFILGLALGSLYIKRKLAQASDLRGLLAIIQVAMGLLAIGSLVFYNTALEAMAFVMQSLAKTDGGYVSFNLASVLIAMTIMLPAAFCAGMTLPLLTEILVREGHGERSVGQVYAINTFGSIVGVIVAVHVGLPLLGIKGGLMLGAAIDAMAGLLLLWRPMGSTVFLKGRIRPVHVTFAIVVAFVSAGMLVRLDPLMMASGVYRFGKFVSPEHTTLLMAADGKTATVHAMLQQGILTVQTNGKTDASRRTGPGAPTSDEYTQIMTGLLGFYHRPRTQYVVNIGIGSGMTTHAVLAVPYVKQVDTIEIERAMVDGARLFGSASDRAFSDPRSRIHIDDAKSFLAVSQRRYDMIISEPSNPWVSGVSGLFTREFYARMKSKLVQDGLFVQWLQAYQLDFDLVASVIKAVGAEFDDYIIYETNRGDMAIIASPSRIRDPDPSLFEHGEVRESLARLNIFAPGDLDLRRIGTKRVLHPYFQAFNVPMNSDYFPILDLRAARDRFLGRTAIALTEMHAYSLPVLDMLQGFTPSPPTRIAGRDTDGMTSPRLRDAVTAWQMAAYIKDGILGDKPTLSGLFGYEMEHVRTHWLTCNAQTAAHTRLEPMLRLAQFVNVALHKSELAEFWAQFARSTCLDALSPTHRAWLAFFTAVGQRDAEGILQVAASLTALPQLKTDYGYAYPPDKEYRQVAIVSALLITGRQAAARREWQSLIESRSERFRSIPIAFVLDALVGP